MTALEDTALMTEAEAKEITAAIKDTAAELFRLVQRAHEGQAWKVLGHDSWAAYVRDELQISRGHAYRLLTQAKVVDAIEEVSPDGDTSVVTEAAARDIAPRIEEVVEAIGRRVEDGGDPDAVIAEVVATARKLKTKTPEDHRRELEQEVRWSRREDDLVDDLYFEWERLNTEHFNGTLALPVITLVGSMPRSPRHAWGACYRSGKYGGVTHIQIRRSLLTGDHPRVRSGEDYERERWDLISDILLHEMIHQHQEETIDGDDWTRDEDGHGEGFVTVADRIAAERGWHAIRNANDARSWPERVGGSRGAWDPHNEIRDFGGGVYLELLQLIPRLRKAMAHEYADHIIGLLTGHLAELQEANRAVQDLRHEVNRAFMREIERQRPEVKALRISTNRLASVRMEIRTLATHGLVDLDLDRLGLTSEQIAEAADELDRHLHTLGEVVVGLRELADTDQNPHPARSTA